MLDGKNGSQIFPRTIAGHEYNALIQDGVQMAVEVPSVDEQVTFLNRRVQVVKSEHIVASFLERASGRLHISILRKLLGAFYAALPSINLRSSTSHCSEAAKRDFALHVHSVQEYNTSSEYDNAWNNACYTTLRKVPSCAITCHQNLMQHKNDCLL